MFLAQNQAIFNGYNGDFLGKNFENSGNLFAKNSAQNLAQNSIATNKNQQKIDENFQNSKQNKGGEIATIGELFRYFVVKNAQNFSGENANIFDSFLKNLAQIKQEFSIKNRNSADFDTNSIQNFIENFSKNGNFINVSA